MGALCPSSPLTPPPARTKTQKACFFPQPPAQFLLSTGKTGVVLKPYTPPPPWRIVFTAGRVGTKPAASQPIQSRRDKGREREDLVGLSMSWLWMDKLPRVGAEAEWWLSFPSGDGDQREFRTRMHRIVAKARGGGCHPGLARQELAYVPNCL